MCILDFFFFSPIVRKKTCYGIKIDQNLKIDQCVKKQWFCFKARLKQNTLAPK